MDQQPAWGKTWKRRGRPSTRPQNVPSTYWKRYLAFVRRGLPQNDETWAAFCKFADAESEFLALRGQVFLAQQQAKG